MKEIPFFIIIIININNNTDPTGGWGGGGGAAGEKLGRMLQQSAHAKFSLNLNLKQKT